MFGRLSKFKRKIKERFELIDLDQELQLIQLNLLMDELAEIEEDFKDLESRVHELEKLHEEDYVEGYENWEGYGEEYGEEYK